MKSDILKELSKSSTLINRDIVHAKDSHLYSKDLGDKVLGHYARSVISVISADFNNNKQAVNLYRDYYLSVLDNINTELGDNSEMVRLKYSILQDVVSLNYLLVAYLIRNEDLEVATELSSQKVESIMDDHYIPRAVLTMSARSGVPSAHRGWFIGRAIDICEHNDDIMELFFYNEKELTKYLCQADFIQYIMEYAVEHDIYDGYPNFLFFPKKYIDSLLNRLSGYKEFNDLEFQAVIEEVRSIRSGEFFMGNQWRGK